MGLRVYFSLSAQGPAVRDDPLVLLDTLTLLRHESLIDNRAVTLVTEYDPPERLEPSALHQRLHELASVRARDIRIRGLRTVESFPNPFVDYTLNEEVVQAWINLRFVCTPPSERRFEMQFVEPEFLADTPVVRASALMAELNTLVGTPLVAACYSQEPAQGAV